MGRKHAKKKGKTDDNSTEGLLMVDPARVRFQHSRIRPYFSGCGRSVTDTLEYIRRGELLPSALPPIQVIVGPDLEDGPCYFSLNNRRLWVLKRCREEGLLPDNLVAVRVRQPKSASETARYSVERCALEAKIIREMPPKQSQERRDVEGARAHFDDELPESTVQRTLTRRFGDDDTQGDSGSDDRSRSNQFSVLM